MLCINSRLINKGLYVLVLGVETSCDETAVALVEKNRGFGGKVIEEIICSQIENHKPYGGVVPELSSREHIKYLKKITEQVIKKSGIKIDDIDAFAATCGPGLLGGLLIGSNFVKSLSLGMGKPFFAINHLQAHILVSRLNNDITFPFLVLLISGGHTQLLIANNYNNFTLLGETLDDALGEAFDKTAKLLGLSYPGGPILEKLAEKHSKKASFSLPRPMHKKKDLDFSFSGLKTAVRKIIIDRKFNINKSNLAHDFQIAVMDCLVDRCEKAIDIFKKKYGNGFFLMSGGVASNNFLRQGMIKLCEKKNMKFLAPKTRFCLDNASMIAWTGIERLSNGELGDSIAFLPKPRWPLNELENGN